ncbi:MAG TPA: Hsp33 family molecular chaperone [Devosia sp.]|nr:Hsp33 family molecular chaperone [Devosia sp.]
MSKTESGQRASLARFGLDRQESGDDVAVPFTLENLDGRGRVVRLAGALNTILTRHDYPAPVARLLGEAVTLAALMGSSLKFEGRFILQTQTDGAINMIVIDLDAPDGLRGYARFDKEALDEALGSGKTTSAALLGTGHLAMTVDQGPHTERYQGIVALEGEGLEVAAEHYFAQSEQIPTKVRLAVAEHTRRGNAGASWRAGGMMVQFFPPAGEAGFADLPGGDTEESASGFVEADNWVETKALFATLSDAELVDPDVSAERLLFRLFNEKGVRVFEPEQLEARCSCSAERTETMLNENFSDKERQEMAVDGQIEVVCEFCSATYHFNPNQF